jgi:hypothetical protein
MFLRLRHFRESVKGNNRKNIRPPPPLRFSLKPSKLQCTLGSSQSVPPTKNYEEFGTNQGVFAVPHLDCPNVFAIEPRLARNQKREEICNRTFFIYFDS